MIRLSCHSENFGIDTLENTFAFLCRLGFRYIDVAARSLMPQHQMVEFTEISASLIRQLSETHRILPDELFLGPLEIGHKPIDPSAGVPAFDPEGFRCFDAVCRFAELAGFNSIMGSAGKNDDRLGYERSFENAKAVLTRMTELAASHGISYHVEPSRQSLLNRPQKALLMAAEVPGLRYTLDFLHYHYNHVPLEESMELLPLAGHMHARQAIAGVGKCAFELGEIDYEEIVKRMQSIGWSGGIAMEFWKNPGLTPEDLDPIDQNILMRYELKKLVRKYYGKNPV